MQSPQSSILPKLDEKISAANKSPFLVHCFGRSAAMIANGRLRRGRSTGEGGVFWESVDTSRPLGGRERREIEHTQLVSR